MTVQTDFADSPVRTATEKVNSNARKEHLFYNLYLPAVFTCVVTTLWATHLNGYCLFLAIPLFMFMIFRLLLLPKSLIEWFVCLTVICFSLSAVLHSFPARIAIAIAKPSLEKSVNKLDSGEEIAVPFRAGLYRIHEIKTFEYDDPQERDNSRKILQHCFWFSEDPWGNSTGLVFAPNGQVHGINVGLAVDLGDNWFLVSED